MWEFHSVFDEISQWRLIFFAKFLVKCHSNIEFSLVFRIIFVLTISSNFSSNVLIFAQLFLRKESAIGLGTIAFYYSTGNSPQ